MKTVLKIVGGLVAVVVILGVSLFFMGGNEINVTESKVINKSPEELYAKVGDYNTWASWSPWAKLDPKMKSTVTSTPGTVGHKNTWSGNDEVGEGMQEIVSLVPNKNITMALEFIKPAPSKSKVTWDFEAVEGGTKVTWHTEGPIEGMGRVFNALMDFDAQISKSFKDGLENLSK